MSDVLVIGDSIASGYVCGGRDREGWPLMLGVRPEMQQGVFGSTAAEWAADVGGQLSRAIQTPADTIILSLLANDLDRALKDGAITPQEIELACRSFRTVVERVRKARTIVLLYTDPFSGRDGFAAVLCMLLNAAIVGLLPEGIETFDTRTVLRPEHFDGVDIHPNRAGHEAIAAGLRSMLTGSKTGGP